MVVDGLEPNSENSNSLSWLAKNCIKDAIRFVAILLETFVEFMPGHFSITKETGKKTMQNNWDKTKMALNKATRETTKYKPTKERKKSNKIVFLLTARCLSCEIS